jgi:hypothetical protein
VVEEGEGKNTELIWLWEALTACGVLPGDLCALARAIHRYGTGKKVGSASCSKPRSAQVICESGAGPSLDVGTSGTRSRGEVPVKSGPLSLALSCFNSKRSKFGFISYHDPHLHKGKN